MSDAAVHVQALFRYPIKSCTPQAIHSGQMEERGFEGDRRWMIVDENGRFLSQRTRPELSLIRATPLDAESEMPPGALELTHRHNGAAPIRIAPPGEETPERTVEIWDDQLPVHLAGAEAQSWIQSVLDPTVQLVYMADKHVRPTDPAFAGAGRSVSFADGYPYLVLSLASLENLNTRLAEGGHAALGIERFRPNIVVDGCAAHAEDRWKRIQLGDHSEAPILRLVKPCARCRLTTLDTESLTYGLEPIHTLAQYRQEPSGGPYGPPDRDLKGLFFGMNAILERGGSVREGARLLVLE
jgi:uncharacterized protein YcbX